MAKATKFTRRGIGFTHRAALGQDALGALELSDALLEFTPARQGDAAGATTAC
jgi:hypothetical protein